jgi:hypothetical protein
MKNPTLLTLLKMGCQVRFPSGYILTGDPRTNYIDTSYDDGCDGTIPDGLQSLNRDGLHLSLKDEQTYRNTH